MLSKPPFPLLFGVLLLPFATYALIKGLPVGLRHIGLAPAPNLRPDSLAFFRADNQGRPRPDGANYVLLFDPKSPALDFKVSLGLSHPLYAKTTNGKLRQTYTPKRFHDIISDDNATLDGRRPIAAINGDYIDTSDRPQGLNVSRGTEYAGDFAESRSSFGISGGPPSTRVATIHLGRRPTPSHNFNLVGGNGRFYRAGQFRDICDDLGEYACNRETNRSMVAVTSEGYVIALVNNSPPNQQLFPSQFDDVLMGIATTRNLGTIRDAILLDGGASTGLYADGKIQVENSNPIGSVFLIYNVQ
jgi:Phosphodiester glycosidase